MKSYSILLFQAEAQLGVKVDRSMISGLSNTLDKLVNKLHDTQARKLNFLDWWVLYLTSGFALVYSEYMTPYAPDTDLSLSENESGRAKNKSNFGITV